MPKSRPRNRTELRSPECKLYSVHRIPNYRIGILIKATDYITAFKSTTGIPGSEVKGASADPTANSQSKSLVKKKKKSLKTLQLTWKIQGLGKTPPCQGFHWFFWKRINRLTFKIVTTLHLNSLKPLLHIPRTWTDATFTPTPIIIGYCNSCTLWGKSTPDT